MSKKHTPPQPISHMIQASQSNITITAMARQCAKIFRGARPPENSRHQLIAHNARVQWRVPLPSLTLWKHPIT